MRRFVAIAPLLLLLGHISAQAALTMPEETWRSWTRAHAPGSVAALTAIFVAMRLVADLGLCAWVLGRHRIREALPLKRLLPQRAAR